MRTHLLRALFHMLLGLAIAIAGLFLPRATLLIYLGTVTAVFLAIELVRFKVHTANRWFFWLYRPIARQHETSRLTGASYLLIASFISFLIFQRDVAVIGVSIMAVGDALAGVVGRKFGKRRVLRKSLEGDLTCLIASIATGLAYYYAGLGVPLPAVLIAAITASIVEALSLPVNDNLSMPLIAGVVMTLMHV